MSQRVGAGRCHGFYVPETQALNRQVRRIASGGPKLEAIYCLKHDNSHPEMDIGHVLLDNSQA